jgi:starvation-inducible DNA-binding protein
MSTGGEFGLVLIFVSMNDKTAQQSNQDVALNEHLNQVLADSYAVMALTHLAHWNVEGQGFFALHTAFQTQYEELFVAIDEIAERVRARGGYAIGGLRTLAARASIQEFSSPLAQEDYVKRLVEANEKLVSDAEKARDLAGGVNDAESQDLMIARITVHQKTLWMLNSFLKD